MLTPIADLDSVSYVWHQRSLCATKNGITMNRQEKMQEIKIRLAKLTPEGRRRVLKAVKASRDVQRFKYLCTKVNIGLATPEECAEYKKIMEGSAKTLA